MLCSSLLLFLCTPACSKCSRLMIAVGRFILWCFFFFPPEGFILLPLFLCLFLYISTRHFILYGKISPPSSSRVVRVIPVSCVRECTIPIASLRLFWSPRLCKISMYLLIVIKSQSAFKQCNPHVLTVLTVTEATVRVRTTNGFTNLNNCLSSIQW